MQISLVLFFIVFVIIKTSKETMKLVKPVFKVGQCVYAKLKGSPAWPSLILEIIGQRARVQFFGWQNQW